MKSGNTTAMNISKKIRETIINCIPYFEDPYRDSVEKLAPFINQMSKEFPKRRERLQHIGLFGYSRGMLEVTHGISEGEQIIL
jgi:phosphoenolpyruvate carboxylase